jgi:hypothetical protein
MFMKMEEKYKHSVIINPNIIYYIIPKSDLNQLNDSKSNLNIHK